MATLIYAVRGAWLGIFFGFILAYIFRPHMFAIIGLLMGEAAGGMIGFIAGMILGACLRKAKFGLIDVLLGVGAVFIVFILPQMYCF